MEMFNTNLERLKVADLQPHERNARTHSKKQVRQIADSIRRFGFTNPVLVDEANRIIAGHGRVAAARQIGMDEVPIIRLDGMNQAAIVENKHLDGALAMAKLMQEQLPPKKRNNNEPCRRPQPTHMFAVPERREEPSTKRWPGRPPLQMRIQIEAARRMLESLEVAHCTAAGPGAPPQEQLTSRACTAQ